MGNDFDIDTGDELEYDFRDFDMRNSSSNASNIGSEDSYNDMENTKEDIKGGKAIKSNTIIIVIVSIIMVIIVVYLARFIKVKLDDRKKLPSTQYDLEYNTDNNVGTGVTGSNGMNGSAVSNEGWTEIDGKQDVQYSDTAEDIFTVTDIEHQARKNGNSLEVRSKLTGSISGYTGTYTIYVDYYQGKVLNVGDTFTVKVSVGGYDGNSVVGIVYTK